MLQHVQILKFSNFQIQYYILLILFFSCFKSKAQWTIQPSIGAAFPINGYNTLVGPGAMLHIDFQKRIKEGRSGIGIMAGWARMHSDNSSDDLFIDSRLDLIPAYVTYDYELTTSYWIPYIGFGLGICYYNLSYDISETEGNTIDNVSFSLMPRVGLRYRVNKYILPFVEVNAPLIMDGPPQGVRNAEKETGYFGVCAGLAYRFVRE